MNSDEQIAKTYENSYQLVLRTLLIRKQFKNQLVITNNMLKDLKEEAERKATELLLLKLIAIKSEIAEKIPVYN